MAECDPYSSLTKRLKRLGEPCPLSPMVDLNGDDDSFVVLWRDDGNIDNIKEFVTNPIDSDLEKEIEEFKKDEQIAPEISSTASSDGSITMEDLKEQIIQLIEENTVLQERIVENNNLMSVQYANLQENNNLIDQLKREKKDLREELDQLKTERCNFVDEREQWKKLTRNLVEDLEASQKEKCGIAEELKHLNFIKCNLDVQITSLKHALNQSKMDQYSARDQIEQVQMELKQVRYEAEIKEKSLNEEIENLQSKLLLADQRPTLEEMAVIREQFNAMKVELLLMQQSKVIADQHVDVLAGEILELRSKCQMQHTEADEICALKAQVDLFKTDYEAEKAINLELRRENQKFTNELRNLRTCSCQLQEEINALREEQHNTSPQREMVSASSDSFVEQPMMCPVCGFGFTTNQALSNHVERCLNHSDINGQ